MRKNITTIIITIIVAISAIVVSMFLFLDQPSLTLIKSDVFFLEPQSVYEERLKEGNYSPEVVFPLTRIYLQEKKYEKAIVILEKYLKEYPNDIRVLEQLGTLYLNINDQLGYASTVERLNELKPDISNLRLLSDIYNMHQEYEKQTETLERLIVSEPDNIQNYLWLAYLYRELLNYEKATIVLETLQKRFPGYINYEIQELWLYSLIRINRTDYAFTLAQEWINNARDEKSEYIVLAVRLANIFFNQNKPEFSYQLLEPSKEYWQNPFIISEIVKTELATERFHAAYSRVFNYYIEHDKPEEFSAITYRAASAYVNNLIHNNHLLQALHTLRTLRQAGFDFEKVYYSTLYLAASFDEDSRIEYFEYLKKEIASPGTSEMRKLQIILDFDYYSYTDAFELEIRSNALKSYKPNEWYFLYEKVLQRQGREEDWRAFLHNYYSRPGMMERDSGAPRQRRLNALQQILEFGTAGAYEPEIRRFAYIAERDWFFLYRDLLYQQGRYEEWERFKKSFINSPYSDIKTKREFAYDAIAKEDYNNSLRIFLKLAENAKPDNPDVEMLLYLLGPQPDEEYINWISTRLAQSISSSEEQAWLKHLFNHGGYQQIVLYVRKLASDRRTPNMTPLYLQSLYYLNNLSHLKNEIEQIAGSSTNINELEFIGLFAKAIGFYEQSQVAYMKLEEIDPKNCSMLLNLGSMLYDQKKYEKAISYFNRYHQQGGDDFISYYYTGLSFKRLNEFMPRKLNLYNPEPYFLKTIEMAEKAEDSKQARSIAAHALMYLNRFKEAQIKMSELIADYPEDMDLLLNYAAMLISLEKYSKASKLITENFQAGFDLMQQKTTRFSMQNVISIQPTQLPNELAIHYNRPIMDRQIENIQSYLPSWAWIRATGYNMLILATEPGFKLQQKTISGEKEYVVICQSPIKSDSIK